ncbi:MAG: tRNA 2-thiocytidine biosynthesis protein TtcA, partial [Ruminiclostridium sp.]|nr:tRNA 2-thiocytidine biosynthesis protein TtcA [Ruminiclostridium sp.]
MTRAEEITRMIVRRFRKPIWGRFLEGIKNYELIQEGDRIAVCISGGKDSMLMAMCMKQLQKYSKVPFEAEYLVMDPGYAPANRQRILDNAALLDIPVKIFGARIFDAVENIGKNPCYMCARMRRGFLYRYAQELGCNKIALGHHFDDVIETILMGMLYGSQMQTMMPKLHSENFP